MDSVERAPSGRRADAGGPAGMQTPVGIPRNAYLVVGALSVLLGAIATVRGTSGVKSTLDSDLTTFFFPAADQILHGHPWSIYAVRAFGGYPNYNPPLSIFLMAPLLGLARALGFGSSPGALISFVAIPFTVFVPVLGYVTVLALRRLYPAVPETQRFLAFLLIVFSPLTWQTYTQWYHLEQPIMLALLVGAILAFQSGREDLGGVLAGVAVLTRTTAIVPLIAFGLLLLFARRWVALVRFGGLAALVTGLGLAPFFLFDRSDTLYSLVTWRGTAAIGGNSIWSIFAYDGTQAASPLRYYLDHFARRLDLYTVILVVAVVAFVAVRRLHVSAYGREAWAVLAIAALAIPMLSKTNWPYYFLEPFVFLLIWEFASMHDRRSGVWRWPVLTLGYLSLAATLSQFIGWHSVGFLDRVAVGLVEFGTMLAFIAGVWYRMLAGRIDTVAAGGRSAAAARGRAGGWPAAAASRAGAGARRDNAGAGRVADRAMPGPAAASPFVAGLGASASTPGNAGPAHQRTAWPTPPGVTSGAAPGILPGAPGSPGAPPAHVGPPEGWRAPGSPPGQPQDFGGASAAPRGAPNTVWPQAPGQPPASPAHRQRPAAGPAPGSPASSSGQWPGGRGETQQTPQGYRPPEWDQR